jgi:ABC-type antimicrobial peptide transport system permease subunit
MDREPEVRSLAASLHHLGKASTTTVIKLDGRQFEVDQLSVDDNYLEAMGLELTAGRGFRDDFDSDKYTVVVNETMVQSLGLGNPVGTVFRIDSSQFEIVGVVKEFHSQNFFVKVKPTMFRLADKETYRYLSVAVQPGSQIEVLRKLQNHWAELYPEMPFDGGLQEDTWGNYFDQITIHSRVWRGFASIAIILAGLGLYGLVSLNVAGRVKEFSIRKVLGAGIGHLARNIGNQYLLLFTIALALGAPVSYVLNRALFDQIYNYYMPITYSGVVIAIGILAIVLMITVATQITKVFKANPVDGLKVE